jgi:hypothetical protein
MELSREKCLNFFVSFRRRQQLVPFVREEDDLVFCYDVDGPINAVGIKNDLKNGDYL